MSYPCDDCQKPIACLQVARCLKGYVDAPPQSWDELCNRQACNQEITGFGVDVAMHLACPGCGAKDFMLLQPMAMALGDPAMERGGQCKECGRGFRMPVTRAPGVTSFTIVQTAGPDLPAWFQLPIPREKDRH